MTAANESSQRAREGVWLSPQGFRAEVRHEAGQWRSYVYMSTSPASVPTVIEHPDEADLADALAKLEAKGWAYADGVQPTGARTWSEATKRQWTPGNVIGAVVVAAIIIVAGIAMLS